MSEQMPDVIYLDGVSYLNHSHVEATTVPKAEHEAVKELVRSAKCPNNCENQQIFRVPAELRDSLGYDKQPCDWCADFSFVVQGERSMLPTKDEEITALRHVIAEFESDSVPRDKVEALITAIQRHFQLTQTASWKVGECISTIRSLEDKG